MNSRDFLDTNVLVYAFAPATDEAKGRVAAHLLDQADITSTSISAQVLGEFYNVLLRKISPVPSENEIDRMFAAVLRFRVEPINAEAVREAIALQRRAKLSYWDALIVATALRARCSVLYTEDLQHGQRFGELQIINPFMN